MGTLVVRPTVTVITGTCANNPAIATSDNSDSTWADINGYGNVPDARGNGSFSNTLDTVVGFTGAASALPAGRQIMSVVLSARVREGSLSGGISPGGVSYRYGNHNGGPSAPYPEIAYCRTSNYQTGTGNIVTVNNAPLTSQSRRDGVTDYGAWDKASVEAIRAAWMNDVSGNNYAGRVYDLWMTLTYSELPATPTSVTPANGATVTVPNPTLGGTMAAISSGQTQKMEWQFASDSGFTTNVKTVTEAPGDLRLSGATTESPSIANLTLPNGTWYMRARAIDQYGIPGPYSSTNTITVNTPVLPTPTTVTPTNGSSVTTMTPTFGATLIADGAGRQQRVEWEIAADSGFTTAVRSLVESTFDYRASGATTEVLPSTVKLTSAEATTWYLHARSVGNDGTTSAWTATQNFTLAMAAPPVPTAVTPAAGATVTTNQPTLGATLGAASEGRTSKVRWQIAQDSGFTVGLRTITEGDVDLRVSGATTEVVPGGSKISQGTWYLRAAAVDQYGQVGAYSSTTTFSSSHPPVAAPTSPIADASVVYATNTNFNWSFSDPYGADTQTAYQIIVERNDTGAVVFDTNKISSTVQTGAIASASLLKDVKLRWKIRVWDQDDVPGSYSPYQLFTLSDLPVVTITYPADAGTADSGAPTVTWTLDGATTPSKRRVIFRRVSDNSIVHDTGEQISTSQSYTPPTNVLLNTIAYTVQVIVTDVMNLVGTDTNTFTASYVAPYTVNFTVTNQYYDSDGYILVDWSLMPADGFFVQWTVYRRRVDEFLWRQMATYTDSSVMQYRDYLANSGDEWVYAVTQSAGRSGIVLESALDDSDPVFADGTHYWLIDPNDESVSIRVDNVTSDNYSDDYDEAEMILIGRGRKVNQGTRHGISGQMTAQFRDDATYTARQKRERLLELKRTLSAYWLRNPFGDIVQVSMGNIGVDRVAGVGTAEFVNVTIPYREVL